MKVAVIGATGQAGSRILEEALRRGHDVTALVHDTSKLSPRQKLAVKAVDVQKAESFGSALAGQEVLISAYNPPRGTPGYSQAVKTGAQNILQAAQKAAVKRLFIVGGAGSLFIPGSKTALIDTPNFPAEYKVEAAAAVDVLEMLRREARLDWVFLSPSAFFTPGERTGKYRLGGDELLSDAQGQSRISMEDFAVALLDEIERPAHHRQRFTVGY